MTLPIISHIAPSWWRHGVRRLSFPAALLFALLSALPSAADGGLRLDGGPFLPYRINAATLVSEDGMAGSARILARDWQGRESLVFEARDVPWTRSLEAAFWLDEDARSLEIVVGGGKDPRRSIALDLAGEAASDAVGGRETERRAALRALDPPRVAAGAGSGPVSIALPPGEPGTVAIGALTALLREEAPAAPMAVLALFAAAASLLPLIPRRAKAGPSRAFAAAALLSAAAAFAVVAALPREARLLVVSIPVPPGGGARVPAGITLVRADGATPSLRATRYAPLVWPEGTRRWDLVSFSAPRKALPLSALGLGPAGGGADCRFSDCPTVVATGGEFGLVHKGRVTGWITDARD